jgi:N-acyl-L-homoserine lactone synthetase
MQYKVIPTAERKWNVVAADETILGTLDRLETGYLATRTSDGNVIKRYRMIDALREAFGEEHQYEIIPPTD